jgi:hypothetical protein
MKKITSLKVLESYRVSLRFNDGAEGEINFRKARTGDSGELIWNDQIDFCPDSLWLQVTGQKPEALLNQNPQLAHA